MNVLKFINPEKFQREKNSFFNSNHYSLLWLQWQ